MLPRQVIEAIVYKHKQKRTRLIDMLRDVQRQWNRIPAEAINLISELLGLSRVEVEGAATFYHFFTATPAGKYAVYLNTNIVSWMKGRAEVAKAFEEEAGCEFGETTDDGLIGLHATPCIGMNDQEPAAIINGIVFTRLTPEKAKDLVRAMKSGQEIQDLVKDYGDGANQSELVRSMVRNNIIKPGPVLLAPFEPGSALARALPQTPEEIIAEIKRSDLLGRGGAGFPTGLKWEFCRQENSSKRYIVGNADEGEPGTFKDRVILTELPRLLFEGMAIAGYAVGAEEGILYLRAEYCYLKDYLEHVLADLRKENILGPGAGGKKGFDFDVTIKLGAGAYICGEETALLESAGGGRGDPRDRPPFPVQQGYQGFPTAVNNIETLCAAAKIVLNGADWFRGFGTADSAGTKLLSVSGDCRTPGIYEIEFGLSVEELLNEAGGENVQAVQVGGPSGSCISPNQFRRRLSFSDLPTGGSIIVIGQERDLFEVIRNFTDFFAEESCGWCVPCRAGTALLRQKLAKITGGKGTAQDLRELESWGRAIECSSRCGLGQTSAHPILTTLQNFRSLYEQKIRKDVDFLPDFDLSQAVKDACAVTGQTLICEETSHD